MIETSTTQGQEATADATVVGAERRARLERLALRVAPAEDATEGVWARLHPDGMVEVVVYMHHDDINTNVPAAPTKALEEALRGILQRHRRALGVQAGRDVVAHLNAVGAVPEEVS